MTQPIIGWDIGGAHLKLARLDGRGRVVDVAQHPCPLWRGLDRLEQLVGRVAADVDLAQHHHAVTMTGELADIFPDLCAGVRAILDTLVGYLDGRSLHVYSVRGFRRPAPARARPLSVASANWHATARFVAARLRDSLVIDIGSTTTDIIPVRGGRIVTAALSDGERLEAGTLLYAGVLRTPIMAVVNTVPFAGRWQTLAAEHFATMADVHVLTGQWSPAGASFETADGAGVAPADCARRLARMLGRDLDATDIAIWRRLAAYIARRHEDAIRVAIERILIAQAHATTVVGAGVGRFLAKSIAARLGCHYHDFASLVPAPARLRSMTAQCAPAVAVARLRYGR